MRKNLSLPTKPSQLKEWIKLVDRTMTQIERWAAAEKWLISRTQKTITEESFGTYSAPQLFLRTLQGQIIVEPIARDVVGADGRIDILSFPSMNRILLVRAKGAWKIKTDARVNWPKPWSKATFLELTDLLVSST